MKNSKLIIVSGMSGAGKSTTAQQLSKQYEQNNIPYLWLHEEVFNHPIRDGEFKVGSLKTEAGMAQNVADMYERWARLAAEIEQSEYVYIMEGCLYQAIIRYFFTSNYPRELITEYYDRVMEILARLNPTIVYLYRSDVKMSFEKAFKVRGEKWQKLILDPEGEGYFDTHEYTGDESIFAMWEDYQELANEMFERYQGSKIKLVTSDGQWDKHIRAATEYLGLEYVPPQVPPALENPEQYCGRYVDGEYVVTFKTVAGELYCQVSWWTNMKLIPLGNDEFEVQSFPIRFAFDLSGAQRSVEVKGIYGWAMTGRTMVAV